MNTTGNAESIGVALLVTEDRWLLRTLAASMHAGRYSILEAASGAEAHLAHAEHGAGTLAFVDTALDVSRPGTLVDVVQALRRGGWIHIITVGDRNVTVRVRAALAAGADGHLIPAGLDRGDPGSGLPAGNRAAATQPDPATAVELPKLSAREVQVVALAARGYPNREIARALGLSLETVKTYLARMNRNTGARDRAHLVLLALRAGVIP